MILSSRPIGLAVTQYWSEFATELWASLRRHRWLLTLVLAYWICGLFVAHYAGLPAAATLKTYLPIYVEIMPAMLVAMVILRMIAVIGVDRPARPFVHLARDLRHVALSPKRVANSLPMIAAMLLFGGTFTLIKAAMPKLHSYNWDPAFEALDRWIHGGVAPWQLLQPWLAHPFTTHVINIAYALWFTVLCFVWLWQALSLRDQQLRLQFFWTLLLVWIVLGNIAATYFASGGPCYYGRLTGLPDPFEPLMASLRTADLSYPVWSLKAQEILWHHYLGQEVQLAAGISAMPSLHVAIATVLALVCWRTNRYLGMAMIVFAAAIMIGSVHLGWHYAIDGYAGALGAGAIWWMVGRCLGQSKAGHLAERAMGIPPNIN